MTDKRAEPNEALPADQQRPPADRWDALLGRYVHVWLWTILFGTNTGVLFTFTNFDVREWRGVGIVLLVPGFLAGALVLQSWLHLYRALDRYLLPMFVDGVSSRSPDPREFAWHLKRSFFLLILASAARIMLGLLELALSTLQ